ncbi:hypothetical protein PPROV_000764700 [Pycnococcus provasolii]|uniref:Uncharacterized protein n=1 Tax=Pycnococcus provasolii TaxID=41880 RepID=A0A830HT43_9CHLO|nr:hypothetical protein PPROV_000764700 [Pycnococcus provasolii]|mmetsp:Transcript_6409/g.14594  ORF Transcript_6409/g.14594 Transcript_6409/m.14594 type:complete len:319 (+) Transcript_6409:105-1061(+)
MPSLSVKRKFNFHASDCTPPPFTDEGEGGGGGVSHTPVIEDAAAEPASKPTRKMCADAQRCAAGELTTLGTIFGEILESDKDFNRNDEWLGFLECHMQREWECGCDFFETASGNITGSSAFCTTHSAEQLTEIRAFLGYFVPRKMGTPDLRDMKRCGATLRKLLSHCVAKGYIDKKMQRELNKVIKVSESFDADGVSEALQRLSDEGYWDDLAKENTSEEDGEDDDDDDDDVEDVLCDECGLTVSEVHSNGWTFESEDSDSHAFLQLPPEVAAMGKCGMSISCMALVEKNGVVRPYGMYGHDPYEQVCANVYPPSPYE